MASEAVLNVTEWPVVRSATPQREYRDTIHWSQQAPLLIDNGMYGQALRTNMQDRRSCVQDFQPALKTRSRTCAITLFHILKTGNAGKTLRCVAQTATLMRSHAATSKARLMVMSCVVSIPW